jgi:aspartate carbamoyltransferase catalytic subunit
MICAQVSQRPRGAPAADGGSYPSRVGAGVAANRFAGDHVLSMAQYDRPDLEVLFSAADEMRASLARGRPDRSLTGRLLVSAFFERSTRTRLAHEAAMIRLGGSVIGFAEPSVTRAGGSTKESDDDIAHMLSLYGDVVVVRHPATGWPKRAAAASAGALFINGGDGVGEHPTQALVDLYTLWQRFGTLYGLRLLLVNDLRMRCVRSLLLGLRHFDCEVYGVGAEDVERGVPVIPHAPQVVQRDSMTDVLPEVDVVYSSPTVAAHPDDVHLNTDRLRGVTVNRQLLEAHGNEHLTVLHPLPRKSELATDLDDTRFNGYWTQAANGIPVRMALLKLMLQG